MPLYISNTWFWFSLAFGIMLLASLIMMRQGRRFYTHNVVVQRFSILDIQFAANARELTDIIEGIFQLPLLLEEKLTSRQVIRALKGQLLVDFLLYMPATYGCIFLLCMKVATKMSPTGAQLFSVLAYLQLLAFVLDAVENIYVWNKIRPGVPSSTRVVHQAFMILQVLKWGSALTAAVCGVFALLHFWLSGLYSQEAYSYLWVILIEIVVFALLSRLFLKTKKKEKDDPGKAAGAAVPAA